ncbi:YolD-like family protein [Bacillaceae bacterium C204]|uniref:YolD-like family protein n=1 Tax=Neobacillus sp. 204 TaxID=3383351 RepID=UPI00397C4738
MLFFKLYISALLALFSELAYATEYNHAVKLTEWDEGFTHDITGRVHYVDPITHELRIEVKPNLNGWHSIVLSE